MQFQAVVSDDEESESSNVLELLVGEGSSRSDSWSAYKADQPGPEQILSAAVIGRKKNGKGKEEKKRTPLKGGGC